MSKRPVRAIHGGASFTLASLILLAGVSAADAAEELPSREEMWRIIQQQQHQIEELKDRLDEADGEVQRRQGQEIEALRKRVEEADRKIEATAEAVEATAETVEETAAPAWVHRVHLGSYGELHYLGGEADEVNFKRFVLLFGYDFTDRIRLYSELELENALVEGGEESGELELEQAWIEFDLDRNNRLRAGLDILPIGILNPTHEPTTFFGVQRNNVEREIIPTTWWEAGVGVSGVLGPGFGYDLVFHSGLDVPTSGGNAFRIRSGRQKVSEATTRDGAGTVRLRWTGIPGVEVAVSGQYQSDITQGALDADATLFTVHTDSRRGPFGLRALYARWDIFGDEAEALGRDEQYGWYVEPAYYLDTGIGELGLFARYLEFNTRAGQEGNAFQEIEFGLNYWPHPSVVVKADFQVQEPPEGTDSDDRVNLGLGYLF